MKMLALWLEINRRIVCTSVLSCMEIGNEMIIMLSLIHFVKHCSLHIPYNIINNIRKQCNFCGSRKKTHHYF